MSLYSQSHRASVAPMLDWTDRHCRYFHRLLTQRALLYTEMVNAGAVVYGGTQRHLQYNEQEHPVALQLGGSEYPLLAKAAKFGQDYGYDEINLNCGCPSERVQRGAFGACLMTDSALVVDCFKAMQDAVSVPVTVKHRIGIDKIENYAFVRDFVGVLAQAGCKTFIVHARNAWLKGLSPKENREIPPLRYDVVYQLKKDFPDLIISINGGIVDNAAMAQHLSHVDGVMVGRAAYHTPWLLTQWDTLFFNDKNKTNEITQDEIENLMVQYMSEQQVQYGISPLQIARHMLNLRHGQRGARAWRQVWSDHHLKYEPAVDIARKAKTARLELTAAF